MTQNTVELTVIQNYQGQRSIYLNQNRVSGSKAYATDTKSSFTVMIDRDALLESLDLLDADKRISALRVKLGTEIAKNVALRGWLDDCEKKGNNE